MMQNSTTMSQRKVRSATHTKLLPFSKAANTRAICRGEIREADHIQISAKNLAFLAYRTRANVEALRTASIGPSLNQISNGSIDGLIRIRQLLVLSATVGGENDFRVAANYNNHSTFFY